LLGLAADSPQFLGVTRALIIPPLVVSLLLNKVKFIKTVNRPGDFLPVVREPNSERLWLGHADGKIYAIPVNVHGQNWMWSSAAAFAKAGAEPPRNWDEFFPSMDKLKAAGLIPIALGGQPWQERIRFNQLLPGKAGKEARE